MLTLLMAITTEITITKMAHDGAGEGEYEGKPVRVFGMLPGEKGVVEVQKHKGLYVGELKEILTASSQRLLPNELHYLSCSPWQVMEYPLQAEWKKHVLTELYGYYEHSPAIEFVTAEKLSGYRTKVEFSFRDFDGPLELAFHVRGGGSSRVPLPEGCMLASERMNRVALEITRRMNEVGYRATDCKTLIVRESKSGKNVIALLYLKTKESKPIRVDDIPDLKGFVVYYSTPKSPASVPTQELWKTGILELDEVVLGMTFRYAHDAFFQNNVPMFEKALAHILEHVDEEDNVLELYAGVGTIGLALAKKATHVHGVEIIDSAVSSAVENALRNRIMNYSAECLKSEKIDQDILASEQVLVLDPPRSGLHPDVLKMILAKLPKKIIYLSCNPETQARDYSAIEKKYTIDRIVGYDFYPNTPHAESLLVLSLRA